MSLIVSAVYLVERRRPLCLGDVTLFLQLGEDVEAHVEHVLLGPYLLAVGRGVAAVVTAVGGETEGYLVLIVVVLVVASETYEDSQLVVLQSCGVGHEVVGVGEHLHALVLSEVERRVLVHPLRLPVAEVLHHHVEGLLVTLHELWLRRVGDACDARGKDVVHWCLVVALLDVHCTHLERTRLRTVRQTLPVHTPLPSHEVERTESQHDGLLESCEEHTHEPDACEVVDGAFLALILLQRDTELIPVDACRVTVAQLHSTGAHVGDEAVRRCGSVAVGIQYLRTDVYLILIIALVLVEGEVLVDILLVGLCLVAGVVALRTGIGVGRVALWVVVELVSVEYAPPLVVVVRTTEAVIVIARRVVVPCLQDTVFRHYSVEGIEPLLVSPELPFLLIVETVESHILQLP